jgi:co-chaperonin GroES (HSP10)
MNFKPTYNRVIITLVEKPRTKGGLILADTKTPWSYARVEAIGPDVTRTKPGDIIAFYMCDGNQLEVDDVQYVHIREDHVVGIYIKENSND